MNCEPQTAVAMGPTVSSAIIRCGSGAVARACPNPSWPYWLAPQAYTTPVVDTATEWSNPAATIAILIVLSAK